MSDRLTFDARHLGAAWQSVAQAASTDKDDVTFYRALAVEFFATGVRLTATDRTVLLTAWVPWRGGEDDPAPELEEAPKEIAVAFDHDRRGVGLVKYAYDTANAEGAGPVDLTLSVGAGESDPLALPGIEEDALIIEMPGHEAVRLALWSGEWPNWRGLLAKFSPKRTSEIALSPSLIERLAKLGKWSDGPLVWSFGGTNKMALLEIEGIVEVRGAAMPMRWEPKLEGTDPGDDG